MKRYGWIVVGLAALDQAVKAYVRTIPCGYTLFEIPGLFSLTHCINTGAAFSILFGRAQLLALLSACILGLISFYALTKMRLTRAACIALACVMGGGIGNLLDRVFFGGVTDYIRLLFMDFPVFNLADIAITSAVGVLIILLMKDALEESTEDKHGSDH